MSKQEKKQDDEIFLGNFSSSKGIGDYLRPLKTLRIGNIAYDINGVALDDCYLPLFINKSEAIEYDKIMMAELKKDRGF